MCVFSGVVDRLVKENGNLSKIKDFMTSPSRPLTVLIGADTYPPDVNGAAQFGFRLASALAGRGHRVHVVAAKQGPGASETVQRGGVLEHRLRSHRVFSHPYMRLCNPVEIYREVGRLLDEVKPDVVHVQCHWLVGRVLIGQAKRRGIRVVATNHVMPENIEPFLPFPRPLVKAFSWASWFDMGHLLKKADVVTTPTPIAVREMLASGRVRGPVLAVSNGIDIAHYELASGEDVPRQQGEVRIFFAGRLAQEKNIDVLIRALGMLPSQYDHVVLEVAGSGEILEDLQQLAAACGVSERVRFLGYVSDEELRAGYLRADIFCQPGTAELQSLVTLEAMSASLPLVLANALALPHLVEEGANGYLFEPGDSADLAVKLGKVLELSEAGRRRMGEHSHRMVARHRAERTWEIFESLYVSDELVAELEKKSSV